MYTIFYIGSTKSYIIGLCETDFKRRFNNHKLSFTCEYKKQTTQLSKHIWTLKNKNIDFRIKWTVLKKTKSYSNITKRCQLCLWEKYLIIMSDKATTLNKRSELLSKCRHSSKILLKYVEQMFICALCQLHVNGFIIVVIL